MRDPPHKEVTAYGCWLSPLTRFTSLHCGGLSSEAGLGPPIDRGTPLLYAPGPQPSNGRRKSRRAGIQGAGGSCSREATSRVPREHAVLLGSSCKALRHSAMASATCPRSASAWARLTRAGEIFWIDGQGGLELGDRLVDFSQLEQHRA